MAIVFADSLQVSGDLHNRVSTSGATWSVTGGAGLIPLDPALGASVVGANGRVATVPEIVIPSGSLTFESRILGSASTAAWLANFCAINGTSVFGIALFHLAGSILVREFTGVTSFIELFNFPRVFSTIYNLRVEFDGEAYSVYIDDVLMHGPQTPVNSPVGMTPRLVIQNSGSGTSNRVYVQEVSIDLAAPPPGFWTERIRAVETI